MPFVSLDDDTALDAAAANPVGFLRGCDGLVIDEIQHAPELILAINTVVDTDTRPGRFLLTGSANLMTVPRVANSLAGRSGIVRLLPLAQAELWNFRSSVLDTVFANEVPRSGASIIGDKLVESVLAGGYAVETSHHCCAQQAICGFGATATALSGSSRCDDAAPSPQNRSIAESDILARES